MNLVLKAIGKDYLGTNPVYYIYAEGVCRDSLAIGKAHETWDGTRWVLEGDLFMNIERFFTEEQVAWIRTEFPRRITMINVTHRLTK